jgi:hypothetical protein
VGQALSVSQAYRREVVTRLGCRVTSSTACSSSSTWVPSTMGWAIATPALPGSENSPPSGGHTKSSSSRT